MRKEIAFVSGALATSMLISGCGPKPLPTENNLLPQNTPLPTLLESTPTPTPTIIPTATLPPEIEDPLTGAIYQRAVNPINGSVCIRLGTYTPENKQTVFGAATVLGEDPAIYNENLHITVYRPDMTKIGSFTTEEIPQAKTFGIVPPGTLVCEDP